MTKLTKKERTATIVAGSILFVLASIFTIAIFLRVFDYGSGTVTERGFLFSLGHMLYSAYGFCSLLIPLFFIISGTFCFVSQWSVQRALCLIVSPLPFFTLVMAEKLIRNTVTNDSHAIAFVKITLLSVVSLLLIAVEYLLTMILAGKIKKKFSQSKSKNVTSAPVFEDVGSFSDDESDDENEQSTDSKAKDANVLTSLVAKIKNLFNSNKHLTSAPTSTDDEDSRNNETIEIVMEEYKAPQSEDDDEEDDGSFQQPEIADNFFEDKKALLADSGDDDITQIEEEEKPDSLGDKIKKPFKNIWKKVQGEFKDMMDYGDQQDKENPSPTLNSIFGKKSEEETEAVDINDFFKKPAERVVLKESDYSDLDLPPRQRVQDTVASLDNNFKKENLEYDHNNPTVIVDEKDFDFPNQDENQDEEIDISQFDEQFNAENFGEQQSDSNAEIDEGDVEDFNDDEDIIGMFERQNLNLDDNDFLNQFVDENQESYEESDSESLDDFIDNQEAEEEIQEPIQPQEQIQYRQEDYEEDEKVVEQIEEENSFLAQIRQRVSAKNQKTPAQIKIEETQKIEEQQKNAKEEMLRQRKLQEEKILARLRQELEEQTKKKEEFNFTPEIQSEITTGSAGLTDVFARMDQDVQNRVQNDPEYKARFTPQVSDENDFGTETKIQQNSATKNESDAPKKQKSFMARAEAIKAEKEAEQKKIVEQQQIQKQEKSKGPDYVFGNPEDDFSSQIDPLANQESDYEDYNQNQFDEVDIEDFEDDKTEAQNDFTQKRFNEDGTEEIDANDFLRDSSNPVPQDDDNLLEGLNEDLTEEPEDDFDEIFENQEEESEEEEGFVDEESDEDFVEDDLAPEELNENQEEEDYVFPSAKILPPKPAGWNSIYNIPYNLLTAYADNPYWIIDDETKNAARNLKNTLAEFKIDAEVTGIQKGPVVTMFEILPTAGVKLNRIVALADNIALQLAASSVRIVAPIPGKHAVGIEIPNKSRAIISIRECLEQDRPDWNKMGVPVVLGKDIQGNTQIIDLVKTPHLLIAGATGAGKSVCVNSMILSMLYKRSPRDVKMILIDPKVVELKLYNDIPHLLTPVITEPKKAMQALQYCLCEMERRYALLDGMSVRDISSYNKKIVEKHIATEKLPYLIVIIDEFADLMATTGKQLEGVLARLAAMSRAVGIHLVLATQRPSADVITGLIKANIPSRIAFMVASKIDSRIILDQLGAEKLLGKGDMLYTSATDPFPTRIQGTFVSDQEVEDVVNAVKAWGEPDYIDDEIFFDEDEDESSDDVSLFNPDTEDPLYEKALDIVVQAGKASASYIQRRLKIGYNRAARLVEEMEERGIVGPANGSKPREIIHMP